MENFVFCAVIHTYLYRNYLNELEKHMFWNPALLNLEHYNHSSLRCNHIEVLEFTLENKVWDSFSRITFQPLDGNCNLLLRRFICQYTCALLENEHFIRITFVERVSRLLSVVEGGRGTQQLRRRMSKKVFYKICDVI